MFLQVGSEREDLEEGVRTRIDELLGRIWMEGHQELFGQVYQMIAAESVSGVY